MLVFLGRDSELLLENLRKIVRITYADLIAHLGDGDSLVLQQLCRAVHTQGLDIVCRGLPGQCLHLLEENRPAIAHSSSQIID